LINKPLETESLSATQQTPKRLSEREAARKGRRGDTAGRRVSGETGVEVTPGSGGDITGFEELAEKWGAEKWKLGIRNGESSFNRDPAGSASAARSPLGRG
jgi:hypothetical protein